MLGADDCWQPLDDEWEKEFEVFMDACKMGWIPFHEQLVTARRLYWEAANQQRLPEGYWIRHECNTPTCVNPEHAELVPVGD